MATSFPLDGLADNAAVTISAYENSVNIPATSSSAPLGNPLTGKQLSHSLVYLAIIQGAERPANLLKLHGLFQLVFKIHGKDTMEGVVNPPVTMLSFLSQLLAAADASNSDALVVTINNLIRVVVRCYDFGDLPRPLVNANILPFIQARIAGVKLVDAVIVNDPNSATIANANATNTRGSPPVVPGQGLADAANATNTQGSPPVIPGQGLAGAGNASDGQDDRPLEENDDDDDDEAAAGAGAGAEDDQVPVKVPKPQKPSKKRTTPPGLSALTFLPPRVRQPVAELVYYSIPDVRNYVTVVDDRDTLQEIWNTSHGGDLVNPDMYSTSRFPTNPPNPPNAQTVISPIIKDMDICEVSLANYKNIKLFMRNTFVDTREHGVHDTDDLLYLLFVPLLIGLDVCYVLRLYVKFANKANALRLVTYMDTKLRGNDADKRLARQLSNMLCAVSYVARLYGNFGVSIDVKSHIWNVWSNLFRQVVQGFDAKPYANNTDPMIIPVIFDTRSNNRLGVTVAYSACYEFLMGFINPAGDAMDIATTLLHRMRSLDISIRGNMRCLRCGKGFPRLNNHITDDPEQETGDYSTTPPSDEED